MERKIGIVALMALLAFGLVVAVNATDDAEDAGKRGFLHRGPCMGEKQGMNATALLEGLGLSENATPDEVREALWQKRLEGLGLGEESTVGEFHAAVKAEMQERRQEMLEKLGLGEDATPEEIREARKAYCKENPDDCPKRMRGGFGRGMMEGFRM
ncbi:MAG: hypothetical protein V1921_05525 [Candidatus Altiarchaeota archaeon]